MAIILNGEVHDPNKNVVEATPRPVLGAETEQTQNGPAEADDQHHIVFNGKKKKLGAKSAYLFDMLTIE